MRNRTFIGSMIGGPLALFVGLLADFHRWLLSRRAPR